MKKKFSSAAVAERADRMDRQVVLPFKKSLEISFKSLKVRFFRSLITTLSLVLAVSFLSFVSVSTDLANGLLSTQDPSVRQELIRAGYDLGPEDTSAGSTPKQRWIVILVSSNDCDHGFDGRTQLCRLIGPDSVLATIPELNLNSIESRDVVEPPVRRQLNAPPVVPAIPDDGTAFDVGNGTALPDESGAEAEHDAVA